MQNTFTNAGAVSEGWILCPSHMQTHFLIFNLAASMLRFYVDTNMLSKLFIFHQIANFSLMLV